VFAGFLTDCFTGVGDFLGKGKQIAPEAFWGTASTELIETL